MAGKPIENLSGYRTESGWIVGPIIAKKPHQTGGCFSVSYEAKHADGRVAFFKALDFSCAIYEDDPARELEALTRSYNFERDLLDMCRGENLDRIVVALDNGSIPVNDVPLGKVFYLIFEMAEGDLRSQVDNAEKYDAAWSLRALHQICVGLNQLHSRDVFHQDVKPSNILLFDGASESKLADLGRAHCSKISAPHDSAKLPGAWRYAPPEQLYGGGEVGGLLGRQCADLYLLGSMVHFFYTGIAFTPALIGKLNDEHKPYFWLIEAGASTGWRGFYKDALPYIRQAHEAVVSDFRSKITRAFGALVPSRFVDEVCFVLEKLSDPDPELRGHPRNRQHKNENPYSLTRFISLFDRLAVEARRHAKNS